MRNFKFTYLWIFLIIFLSGKIHSGIATYSTDATYSKEQKVLKAELKKAADTAHAKYKFGRTKNKKPRGKRVPILEISSDVFVGFFVHKTFTLPYTERVYPSFQHCVSLQRGPPVV